MEVTRKLKEENFSFAIKINSGLFKVSALCNSMVYLIGDSDTKFYILNK